MRRRDRVVSEKEATKGGKKKKNKKKKNDSCVVSGCTKYSRCLFSGFPIHLLSLRSDMQVFAKLVLGRMSELLFALQMAARHTKTEVAFADPIDGDVNWSMREEIMMGV